MTLLRLARQVTSAPLVRADMRQLPIRPGSMDLTVNLFTSFGYFEQDAEHTAALGEMIATVRPGGWFVIDFLNPAAVRRQLVPEETLRRGRLDGSGLPVGLPRRTLCLQDHPGSRRGATSGNGCACSSQSRWPVCWRLPASLSDSVSATMMRHRSPRARLAPFSWDRSNDAPH